MLPKQRYINWDLILTITFYLLGGASILSFVLFKTSSPRLFMYLGCVAIVARAVYYIKRFIQKV